MAHEDISSLVGLFLRPLVLVPWSPFCQPERPAPGVYLLSSNLGEQIRSILRDKCPQFSELPSPFPIRLASIERDGDEIVRYLWHEPRSSLCHPAK